MPIVLPCDRCGKIVTERVSPSTFHELVTKFSTDSTEDVNTKTHKLHPRMEKLKNLMSHNDRKKFDNDVKKVFSLFDTSDNDFRGGDENIGKMELDNDNAFHGGDESISKMEFDNDNAEIIDGGDANVEIIDNDTKSNPNDSWRRILFKIVGIDNHPDVIVKMTPCSSEEFSKFDPLLNNIRNIRDLSKNTIITLKKILAHNNSYLLEIFMYKITQFMNDAEILEYNNGIFPFFKYYDAKIEAYDDAAQGIITYFNGEEIFLNPWEDDLLDRDYDKYPYYLLTFIEAAPKEYTTYSDFIIKKNLKLKGGTEDMLGGEEERNVSLSQNKVNLKMINMIMTLYKKYKFVHADLHNSNFMINDEGTVKIFDFDNSFYGNYYNNNTIYIQKLYLNYMKKIVPMIDYKLPDIYIKIGLAYDIGFRLLELSSTQRKIKNIDLYMEKNVLDKNKDKKNNYKFVRKAVIGYLFLKEKTNCIKFNDILFTNYGECLF